MKSQAFPHAHSARRLDFARAHQDAVVRGAGGRAVDLALPLRRDAVADHAGVIRRARFFVLGLWIGDHARHANAGHDRWRGVRNADWFLRR